MKIIGVYGIFNTKSNKWYVGSSVNIARRKATHLRDLRKRVHNGVKLLRAWEKYEEEVWTWHILEVVEDKKLLIDREQYWVDKLNSFNDGYNSLPFAGKSMLGIKQSPESIAKRVATRKANGGFVVTEEMRVRIGNTQRGKKKGPMSEEQKRLISKIRKERMTDEEKKACGDRARGRVHTPEQREQNRESHLGLKMSEETKEKMSKAAKGVAKNPESIRKMLLVKMEKGGIKLSKKTCEKYGIPFSE